MGHKPWESTRPGGCAVTLLAGLAATFVACWPLVEAYA
jgi:hypothetical protein